MSRILIGFIAVFLVGGRVLGVVQELQRMGRPMAWKVACSEDAIGQNDLKEFDIDGVTVLLARVGEEYFAYPPLCPHQEEPLRKGLCDGEVITCFKHIWQWDLTTGEARGEAEKPLLCYPVRLQESELWIDFERELTYEYD